MWTPFILLACLLLISPGLPGVQAALPPVAHPRHPDAGPLPERAAQSPLLTQMNFSWDHEAAKAVPANFGSSSGGLGLTGLATDGPLTVLFGSVPSGTNSFTPLTYLYNETNNTWWQVKGVMPPPLANFSMTSDDTLEGGSAVLFAGENLSAGAPGPLSNTTWLFSFATSSWERVPIAPPVSPVPSEDVAMTADPATGDLLVIGGWNDTAGVESGFWELNFSTSPAQWTLIGPAPEIVPFTPGVFGASLISTGPNHYLLADGCSNDPTTTCTNRTAAITLNGLVATTVFSDTNGPQARAYATWTWDPDQSVAILYGGEVPLGSAPTFLSDSWEYIPEKNLWLQQSGSPAPAARALAPGVWIDAPGNETMLLSGGAIASSGGTSLVWRFTPTLPLSVFVNTTLGATLAGALVTVNVYENSWSKSTNATGVAAGTVGAGRSLIVASLAGYYNGTVSITTVPTQPAHASVVMVPLPILAVEAWKEVDGTPVPFSGVTLLWNRTAPTWGTTDAAGWYNHTADHGGPVTVVGDAQGYRETSNSTNLAFLGITFLNLTLLPAPPANLSVHTNSSLGGPLEGVWVNVTNYTHANRTTSANGWANFTDLAPGDLNATIVGWTPTFYESVSQDVFLPADNTTVLFITLVPLPVLTIRTWANAQGKIVPLGSVYLTSNWSAPSDVLGTSTGSGWLNRSMPHDGAIQVEGTLIGYSNATATAIVPYTGRVWTNLTLIPEFIDGIVHVNNSVTGAPLNSAIVSITDPGGSLANTTNGAGYSNFTALLPGHDTFEVLDTGYYANRTAHLVPGGRTYWLNVSLVPWPSLHVRVRGAGFDGSPDVALVQASVFRNGTFLGDTLASGWLNLSNQAPGAATLLASHAGYRNASRSVALNHTGTLNVTLVLQPITGNLSVHVVTQLRSGTQNIYLASVNVTTVAGFPVTANITDAEGWANITLLQGSYEVVGWAYGYLPASVQGPFEIGNHMATFNLTRIPGANVSALVLDKNTSSPIDNASVLFALAGLSLGNATNGAGWTNVTDIWPAGDWQVYATASGFEPNVTSIQLSFRQVVPEFLIYLVPISGRTNTTTNTTQQFSLVPPQEQSLWWPFLALPIVFFVGAVIVVAYQSARRRQGST